MFAKRTVSVILSFVLCLLCFVGCTAKSSVEYKYDKNGKIKTLDSCVLAENDNLKLSWNNDRKGLTLLVKKTGKEWKNFDENASEPTSTLDIYVQSQESFNTDFFSSQDVIKKGKISAEKVKNGIKLTYYFEAPKVSVPITYELREDSMLVSVNGKDIGEEGTVYRVNSIIPSPMLMSVSMEQDDSYIFVSDGIGAIVDTKLTAAAKRDFSFAGANAAALSTTSEADPYDNCGMRAFGLKDKSDAMFCIAEDTAGAVGAGINAGDMKSDVSKISPTIIVADYDYTKGKATNSGDVKILSDRVQSTVSVGYYPLSGDDANYIGMAKCYRDHLNSKGLISDQKRDFTSPYAVTALGGVMVTESLLGFPKKSLKVATTLAQAKDLIESLSKTVGSVPVARIRGYGDTGLDVGKVGGGFNFPSAFGNDDDLVNLQKYCSDNGRYLYTDFDIVRFSKSGSGFSYANDAAKTATLHAAEFSNINVPLRDFNNTKYQLLSRTKIGTAVDKLLSFANKKSLSGICLTCFGSMSYSDYTDIKYAVTGRAEEDAKTYVEQIKKSGVKLSGSSPAYYAAGLMDTVFEAPLEASGMYQYYDEIPFYQMVYSGIVPMYSSAINSSSNPKRLLMLAAASGTGIGFSVINKFEPSYMENNAAKLYNYSYGYTEELAESFLSAYKDIYSKTAGQTIVKYEYIDDGRNVTVTEFANGVKVYANHSSSAVTTPVGKFDAYGFKMERG